MRSLILGGARSGKSAHAEGLVARAEPVRYVATGRRNPSDDDWSSRIDRHRDSRPAHWLTVEVASAADLVAVLSDSHRGPTLVDDLGTWLTGAFDDLAAWDSPRGTVTPAVDALVDVVARYTGDLVMVTPEVGLGVVPESAAGRLFRDEIGSLNSRLADQCDSVHLVVAGLAVELK
ncbi:putative cobinamide kinase/cobinamide phosphate guanylyltransferase CobU [Rhodococcoides trifolii]|uniref:Adenosylcobinamide kinase n=1 Tax=Rhodococcoides trifolii TaxID=908250 RepID=A0A917FU18_9NOCA|nr:bifunctional adenosylcobinamide kinase/adenosylcobinamide-phosphate guanylyltransferase [Rhodococcus trifolii]GGG05106.1 putative cobinamide kinase/cobinamide phosphate guanylyltransferase CobU [Rhodococcus trifolii]